jgi:hypothetical protein
MADLQTDLRAGPSDLALLDLALLGERVGAAVRRALISSLRGLG